MDPYPTKYRNKIISIKVYKHFSREWRYPDFTPTSLNLFLSEYLLRAHAARNIFSTEKMSLSRVYFLWFH